MTNSKPVPETRQGSWRFWRRALPMIVATFVLPQLVGCGGCGGGGSNAQRSDDGVAETGTKDGPAGTENTKDLLAEIQKLQSQVDQLRADIDTKDNPDTNTNIGSTGCSQIGVAGLVRCDPNARLLPNGSPNPAATSLLANTSGTAGLGGNGTGGTSAGADGSGASSASTSGTGASDASASNSSGSGSSGSGGGLSGPGPRGSGSSDVSVASVGDKAKEDSLPGLPGAVQSGGGGGGGGKGSGGGGGGYFDSSGGGGSGGVNGVAWVPDRKIGSVGSAAGAQSADGHEILHGPGEDIFKVVERRYTETAMQWTRESMSGPGSSSIR